MNEEVVIQWLRGNWLAFILAFIPPLPAALVGPKKTAPINDIVTALEAWVVNRLKLRKNNVWAEGRAVRAPAVAGESE